MKLTSSDRALPKGVLLRTLRERKEVSGAELARRIECSRALISRIELGERVVTIEIARRLGKYFRVPAMTFLDLN